MLRIFSEEDSFSNHIASYSGPNLPIHLDSYSNEILVEFSSDGETQGKGFIITISFERKGMQ